MNCKHQILPLFLKHSTFWDLPPLPISSFPYVQLQLLCHELLVGLNLERFHKTFTAPSLPPTFSLRKKMFHGLLKRVTAYWQHITTEPQATPRERFKFAVHHNQYLKVASVTLWQLVDFRLHSFPVFFRNTALMVACQSYYFFNKKNEIVLRFFTIQ